MTENHEFSVRYDARLLPLKYFIAQPYFYCSKIKLMLICNKDFLIPQDRNECIASYFQFTLNLPLIKGGMDNF